MKSKQSLMLEMIRIIRIIRFLDFRPIRPEAANRLFVPTERKNACCPASCIYGSAGIGIIIVASQTYHAHEKFLLIVWIVMHLRRVDCAFGRVRLGRR